MGTTNCNNYNNPIALSQGGFAGVTKTASFNNASPSGTKGDVIAYSGTHNIALGVGTNGQFFTANSAATNGVNWAAGGFASSVGITSSQFTVASTPVTGSGTITVNLPASITGRNLLLNGDVAVWQRTTGGTGSIAVAASQTNAKVADGYYFTTGATQASVVSQQAGATSGRYYIRLQRNSGQTGTAVMRFSQTLNRSQSVGIAGQVITISLVGLCGANFSPTSGNITVAVNTGTGTSDVTGSPTFATGNSAVISQTVALTTSAQTITYTSAALGSTVTQLAVVISWTPSGTAGAADWAEFGDIKVELGALATPFERKSFAQNWKECMYFYTKSFNYNVAPAQNAGTGNGELYLAASNVGALANKGISFSAIRFPNVTVGTVTLFNPAATNAQIRDLTQSADYTSTAQSFQRYVLLNGTGNLATLPGDRNILNYTNEMAIQMGIIKYLKGREGNVVQWFNWGINPSQTEEGE